MPNSQSDSQRKWRLHPRLHGRSKAPRIWHINLFSALVLSLVAVALVVAYRRQRDLEQGKFVEGFGAAAKQLGDADAAVRMAGVYAMAGVAKHPSSSSSSASMCCAAISGCPIPLSLAKTTS